AGARDPGCLGRARLVAPGRRAAPGACAPRAGGRGTRRRAHRRAAGHRVVRRGKGFLSMAIRTAPNVDRVAHETLSRATQHLLSLQAPAGWWKGELETNVTMDAEDLLLRAFLGVLQPDVLRPTANWIRSQQRDDGTWANFWRGPGELSTTVEAYAALRLAGDPADAAHMGRARTWILDQGGLERARVFTRMWMALFGIWAWEDLPVLPPEIVFFPRWFPLNPYDFGSWARQTIVPLTILSALKPVRRLPFDLAELRSGAPPLPRHGLRTWEGRFERVDDL